MSGLVASSCVLIFCRNTMNISEIFGKISIYTFIMDATISYFFSQIVNVDGFETCKRNKCMGSRFFPV